MVYVCIQKDLFPAGEALFDILTMRMASVQWHASQTQANNMKVNDSAAKTAVAAHRQHSPVTARPLQ